MKDGNLIVTVNNQGSAASGPCKTAVDFGNAGFITKPTPPLAPGASANLSLPTPSGCFNPDCDFTIIVDVDNEVMEAGEGNNVASGICIG